MLNLQETIALNNLEHAINNAKFIGCDCNGKIVLPVLFVMMENTGDMTALSEKWNVF